MRLFCLALLSIPCVFAADNAGPYLANVHQLTSGGQNAEAYWSPDSKRLIFQSTRGDSKCDQMYVMNADGSDQHMVSTAKAELPAAISCPTANTSSMHPRIWRRPAARRTSTAAKAIYGRFIPAMTFSSLKTTARTQAR